MLLVVTSQGSSDLFVRVNASSYSRVRGIMTTVDEKAAVRVST
jgi:hypothetical protein